MVLYSFYRTDIERPFGPDERGTLPMTQPSAYFMHDQVRHRVAHIMRGHNRPRALTSPVWPLIAVIAALTLVNVVSAIPPL
jgi:hypothetical protein